MNYSIQFITAINKLNEVSLTLKFCLPKRIIGSIGRSHYD